jgi:hypothetical protein
MTIIEMKSAAYDCLAQIEYLQKRLAEINQEIAKKIQEENGATDRSNDGQADKP